MIEDTDSHCESCGVPIADADPSHYHGDGVTTCIKCAPTFADLLELTKERIEGDDDDPEQTASVAYWIASHLASGGNLSDKALTSPEGQIAPPTPITQAPGEDIDAATGTADDALPGTADQWRAGLQAPGEEGLREILADELGHILDKAYPGVDIPSVRFIRNNEDVLVSLSPATLIKAALAAMRRVASPSPDLVAATRLGLEAAECEHALILESHCKLGADLEPRRETLDEDVRELVEDMEANIAKIRAALRSAGGE